MDFALQLLEQYGLLVVFVAVLLEQGGLPVPAYPVLIVASSLAFETGDALSPIVLAGVVASLLADFLWFVAGRRYGARMIRLMCHLSLSPDSCVLGARNTYSRWGVPTLIVAKFVPGLAAVATTMAGQMKVPAYRFALYDGIGAALYVCLAVAIGVSFHDAVGEILAQMEGWGRQGLMLVMLLLGLYVSYKWWHRRRFLLGIRMPRISVEELQAQIESGLAPVIVDVRHADQREASGWIPASLPAKAAQALELPIDSDVVLYCDCPNDASAARAAQDWKKRGFSRARPLAGGFEAWRQHGLPIERALPPAIFSDDELEGDRDGIAGGRQMGGQVVRHEFDRGQLRSN